MSTSTDDEKPWDVVFPDRLWKYAAYFRLNSAHALHLQYPHCIISGYITSIKKQEFNIWKIILTTASNATNQASAIIYLSENTKSMESVEIRTNSYKIVRLWVVVHAKATSVDLLRGLHTYGEDMLKNYPSRVEPLTNTTLADNAPANDAQTGTVSTDTTPTYRQ